MRRAAPDNRRRHGGRLRFAVRMAALVMALAVLPGCFATQCFAAEGYDQVAPASDQASSKSVLRCGMTPIRVQDVNEGSYEIEAVSSSSFFRIEKAVLTVKDGRMRADLTLSSVSYRFIYPGTAAEAAAAPEDAYIKAKDRDGRSTFRMEVRGLNEEIPCAAFSKKKKQWYDRTILLDASSLPEDALKIDLPDYDKIEKAMEALESGEAAENGAAEGAFSDAAGQGSADPSARKGPLTWDPVPLKAKDGEYSIQVNMAGGSGRASVTSPTWLIVKDGHAWARLLWSSTYYDYMIVGGKKYMNETTDGGNSSFTIPIAVLDEPMPVIADTTAMGDPVEIEYELTFYRDSIGSKSQIPQEAATNVLVVALIIIVLGGILNFIVKKRRKQ